jgi:hypothetical protein
MCGFCAVFAGSPHWVDGPAPEQPDDHTRHLVRRARLQLVNAVIALHGCVAEDWHGGQYILRSQRGRSEIVNSLPEVWALVEQISGKPLDPMAHDTLAMLRARLDA